jgi:hypothetical protein
VLAASPSEVPCRAGSGWAIDAQLTHIADTMEGAGLDWWIDSGTLLGLVRDGRLFPHDQDVDLGCWSGQAASLSVALEAFRSAGYRVGRRRYRRRVRKYWLYPRTSGGTRSIDIKIFEQHGEWALCPGALIRSRPRESEVGARIADLVRLPLATVWRRRFSRSWSLPILGIDFSVTTWAVPARFFRSSTPERFGGTELPVPRPVDQYLGFRYGDWREPAPNWETYRDDGAIVLSPPEDVIEARVGRSRQHR